MAPQWHRSPDLCYMHVGTSLIILAIYLIRQELISCMSSSQQPNTHPDITTAGACYEKRWVQLLLWKRGMLKNELYTNIFPFLASFKFQYSVHTLQQMYRIQTTAESDIELVSSSCMRISYCLYLGSNTS